MSGRFWFAWARRFRGQLALIALLSLLASVATLAVPWLAAQALSGLLTGETAAIGLAPTLALLVAALVGLTALTIAANIVSRIASVRILTQLREAVYTHVQSLPIRFHEDSRKGDMLSLTTFEVENLSDFLGGTLAGAPALILTALGAMAVLFAIDPAMALIVPLIIPAFVLAMKLSGRRLRTMSQDLRNAEVELLGIAERDLKMVPAIKSFAAEDHHRARFAAAAENARAMAVRQARLDALIGPLFALFAALAAIAVLVVAGERMSTGADGVQEVFAFLLYAALLTRPIGGLANMYGKYQIARGTLVRLEAVLELKREPGYEAKREIVRARGAIRFEGVDFAYPGRPPVLTGIDLDIAAGEIVALTGPNGVGKSTIARLLLRFCDPDAGAIRLDGEDIAGIQLQSLRRQFGVVPQRALLFDASLAENIAFGEAEPSRDRIEEAARAAQAADLIRELPDGIDTLIGDNGVRLSGGQRQRAALARALYHDPPIYILDEATSMFDLDSEAAFVERCVASLKDRTVILITHRPKSLALADRVLRLGPDGFVDLTGVD
ncbi:MAG: ABC transporter ATP-binding protein [Erythrobacter sp.]|uniref:ABC transporter ATP-binding protein n=1 Tax=Erythrobacter sp. TaxID=1042 RepID=UPI003C741347